MKNTLQSITAQTPATQTTQQTAQTPFDPTICFTCFGDYVEALLGIEQAEGAEVAFSAFKILADFCLYGIEPDPDKNPWGWAWSMVERKAENSMNNRRRGFGKEDAEKTAAIKEYLAEHPEDSMRAVARAVGCSVGKVCKVAKAIKEAPSNRALPLGRTITSDIGLYNTHNSSREREREHLPPNSATFPVEKSHSSPTQREHKAREEAKHLPPRKC